jgi:hypothetical protein
MPAGSTMHFPPVDTLIYVLGTETSVLHATPSAAPNQHQTLCLCIGLRKYQSGWYDKICVEIRMNIENRGLRGKRKISGVTW